MISYVMFSLIKYILLLLYSNNKLIYFYLFKLIYFRLDTDSSLLMLKNNLREYSEFVRREKSVFQIPIEEELKNLNIIIPQRHSALTQTVLKQHLKPPPCAKNNNFICTETENVNEQTFKEFMSACNKKSLTKLATNPNQNKSLGNSFKSKYIGQTFLQRPYAFEKKCNKSSYKNKEDLPQTSKYSKYVDKEPEIEKQEIGFKTAKEELKIQNFKKYGSSGSLGGQKRKLGLGGGGRKKFVSPMLSNNKW